MPTFSQLLNGSIGRSSKPSAVNLRMGWMGVADVPKGAPVCHGAQSRWSTVGYRSAKEKDAAANWLSVRKLLKGIETCDWLGINPSPFSADFMSSLLQAGADYLPRLIGSWLDRVNATVGDQ